jgi:hypothetical protein
MGVSNIIAQMFWADFGQSLFSWPNTRHPMFRLLSTSLKAVML